MSFFAPPSSDRVSLSLEHQNMSDLDEQKAGFSIPLYNWSESHLAFFGRGQRTELDDNLRFAPSGVEIPEEFGSADFGLAWAEEDLGGNKFAANASYGNAGTRLFSGDSDPVVAASVFIERKKLDHSWLYFIVYSNNRTTLNNIPIPGVAYSMTRKTYTAVFGLPFIFLNWRPNPVSMSLTVSPFGANFDTGIRVVGPMQIFASTSWSPKAYQNLVQGSDDRLIFDKREAGGGVRAFFGPVGSVSLGYFYGFGRRFLLGRSISDSGAERMALKDTSGVQAKAKVSF